MAKAFDGVRVVDLSNRLSGAWAARLFGDFGADVVLAEPPEGHVLRREPPFLDDEPGPERSVLHAYANWNKRSIAVHEPYDLAALAAGADVLVTTAARPWPEPLAAAIDALPGDGVHLSITPHGLEGPLSRVPGNNLTACARVGWSVINRLVDEPPLQLPVHQAGYIAGVAGHVGACAALLRRERTDTGERVDVSELEALALTNAPWAILGLFIGGDRLAHGPGGARRRGEPSPLWETANGPMNFGFGDWARWPEAMELLGLDELARDPVYEPVLGRNTKDPWPVRHGLARAAASRDKWELFHGLSRLRCLAGVVQDASELAESEQLHARGFVVDAPAADSSPDGSSPDGSSPDRSSPDRSSPDRSSPDRSSPDRRKLRAAGPIARLSETPWALARPAPRLDEHGAALRGEYAFALPSAPPDESALRAPPLAGVRVLAFTQAWAGTFGTELLARLGADVVQIESRRRPDVWRGAGAPVPPAVRRDDIEQSPLNTNGMYNSVNMNKRAITLDMTHPRGREIFWRLVPRFDVVADNFSPHVMPNWGVTLETLREVKSDIVFASVSGYGTEGPLAEYPANGHTTEPMSGLASIHGYAGDRAANTGGLIPDPISGYCFAAAILAALYHKARTGVGQRVDAAMIEAVAVQVGDAIMEFDANGAVRRPAGNRHPRCAPHGVYRTADGEWVAVAVESDAVWAAVADRLSINEPRYRPEAARKAHEAEIDALVAEWCSAREADALVAAFTDLGVAAARVESFQEVYGRPCPQFLQRGFMARVTHPETGTHYLPSGPWVFSESVPPPLTRSPCFGEHSAEVLREELGIGREEYEELVRLDVTGTTRV